MLCLLLQQTGKQVYFISYGMNFLSSKIFENIKIAKEFVDKFNLTGLSVMGTTVKLYSKMFKTYERKLLIWAVNIGDEKLKKKYEGKAVFIVDKI